MFVLPLLGFKSSLHVKEISIIKRDFQKFFQQVNCLGRLCMRHSECAVLWDCPVPLVPGLSLAQLVLWMPCLPPSIVDPVHTGSSTLFRRSHTGSWLLQ